MSDDYSRLHTSFEAVVSCREVVPNFHADTLYPARSFMGRLWRSLFALRALFLHHSETIEDARLRCFQNIEKLFLKAAEAIRLCHSEFQKNPFQMRHQVLALAEKLPAIFDLGAPFLLSENMRKIESVFEKALGHPVHFAVSELASFERDYAHVACVGIVQMPLPREALAALLRRTPLTNTQDHELAKFLVALEKKAPGCELLHEALGGLFPEEPYESIARLELALMERGCTLFNKGNRRYTAWLESLAPGKRIDAIELGFPCQFSAFGERGFILFEKAGNELVVFGKNRTLLGAWSQALREERGLLPGLAVKSMAPDGRYAVVEKVASIEAFPWKSHFGKVCVEDEPLLNQVCDFLHTLAVSAKIPKTLSPSLFFLRADGKLCTMIPLQGDHPHDYNALVRFALDATGKNYLLFRYVMRRSDLKSHPVADFYLHVCREHLLGKPSFTIEEEAALRHIGDVRPVMAAKEMIQKLQAQRERLFCRYLPQLRRNDAEACATLRHKIGENFLRYQQEVGWPVCEWGEAEFLIAGLDHDLIGEKRI